MVAVCLILLTIALVNVFSTIVFQYIDRKRGLAMLWSLGQTKQGLLRILILETARSFFLAALIGIPVSCLLCYHCNQGGCNHRNNQQKNLLQWQHKPNTPRRAKNLIYIIA